MNQNEDAKPVAADDAMLELKRCMAKAGGRTGVVDDGDGNVLVVVQSLTFG